MKTDRAIHTLALLVALLSAIYAGTGLFSRGGDGPFTFTTLHGTQVEIYGLGIYQYDSAFKAPILRGTDAVTFFLCVPTLLVAIWLSRRGSLRGRLFLVGMLAYFLYNAISLAFGAAYNNLLLVYIASASASLFAFVMAFQSIDRAALAVRISEKLPRRALAIFTVLAGSSVAVWLIDILAALAQNGVPPHLGPYTTEVTYPIDLGVILPTALLAGRLVWRRSTLGIMLSSILLTINAIVGPIVAGQSIMQALDGIEIQPIENAIYVAPFIVLSLIAALFLVSIYRNIGEPLAKKDGGSYSTS